MLTHWNFESVGYADLKQVYREEFYSGDPFGSSMAWLFDVCAFLYEHSDGTVPGEAGYSPGPSGPDIEDEARLELLMACPVPEIERFGRLLNRHIDICKATGKDY